jgi:hypothetical protein
MSWDFLDAFNSLATTGLEAYQALNPAAVAAPTVAALPTAQIALAPAVTPAAPGATGTPVATVGWGDSSLTLSPVVLLGGGLLLYLLLRKRG